MRRLHFFAPLVALLLCAGPAYARDAAPAAAPQLQQPQPQPQLTLRAAPTAPHPVAVRFFYATGSEQPIDAQITCDHLELTLTVTADSLPDEHLFTAGDHCVIDTFGVIAVNGNWFTDHAEFDVLPSREQIGVMLITYGLPAF